MSPSLYVRERIRSRQCVPQTIFHRSTPWEEVVPLRTASNSPITHRGRLSGTPVVAGLVLDSYLTLIRFFGCTSVISVYLKIYNSDSALTHR